MVEEVEKEKIKKIKFPKKYEASYILSENIDRIYNIITLNNFEKITNQTSIKTSLTNYPIFSPLNYQIDEYSELNFSKGLIFLINNIELPFDIQVIFLFKTNTIDNTTLFTIIINLKNVRFKKNNNLNKIIRGCKKLCIEYIDALENLLKKNNQFLYQYESIIINNSKEKIWDFILNLELMKKFHHITIPEYNKLEFKEGNIIEIFVEYVQKKISMKIGKIKHNKLKKKSEFHIYPLDNFFSSQEIIFTIISLSENSSFVSITHKFNENVTLEQMNKVEKKKKFMLNLLKNYLEEKKIEKKEEENYEEEEEEEESTDENERECKSEFDINNDNNNFKNEFFELAKNLTYENK